MMHFLSIKDVITSNNLSWERMLFFLVTNLTGFSTILTRIVSFEFVFP